LVTIPSTTLGEDVEFGTPIYDFRNLGDTLSIDNFKFCFLERRSYFIFHHFDSGKITISLSVFVLQWSGLSAYIYTYG
jgi:hypothetical protein